MQQPRDRATARPHLFGADDPPEDAEPGRRRALPEGWEAARLLDSLRRHAPALGERYAVKSLGLFGSYVRNEQRRGSDLDVLVEFKTPPSLLQFIELEQRLSDLLGVKVDLVMWDALKPAIGRHILDELVPV